MSVQTSLATEKNQKMQSVKNQIEKLLQNRILNEVPEIKKDIEELLVKVSAINFKNENAKYIEGNVYTAQEILEMIKESSGYNKWKFDYTERIDAEAVTELKETFNIEFKEQEIMRHIFSRSTHDRNALSMIIVTALPGLFQVELQTDRVGYGLDGLVNVKKFKQGIAAESD